MMKNILVPTDLSDCTSKTCEYAIMLGIRSNSKIFFYNISQKQNPGTADYFLNCIKQKCSKLKIDFEELQTVFISEEGTFSNENIRKIIKKNKIDLLIMGASHDGHKTTFYGSQITSLINEITCPVLSVPRIQKEFSMEKIGFASELFDLKTRIKSIIPFARMFDANIEIFHIYPVYPQEVDITKFKADKVLEKIRHENDYKKISIQFVKTSYDNETVTGIRKYIDTAKPDLLVMFHKPRGIFDKLFLDDGATPHIIKTGSVPVLALNKRSCPKIM